MQKCLGLVKGVKFKYKFQFIVQYSNNKNGKVNVFPLMEQ